MEKEKKLLNAIGDIDEKYIEEAKPEKVIRIPARRSRKPLGIIAAAAVVILGLGFYMKMNIPEQASTMMAPAEADEASMEKSVNGPEEAMQEKAAGNPDSAKFEIHTDSAAGLKSSNETAAPAMVGAEMAEDENSATEENSVQSRVMIANPWKDSESLSEAEADAGFDMRIPEAVNSCKPTVYRSVKDDMLEIIYSGTDGKEAFRIRKAHQSDEDISGDYTVYDTEKDITVSDINAHIKANGENVFVAVWSKDNFNYAVIVDENSHFTEEEITKLISEID
ncbi:hypothetical protein [Oribacterium sp. P6A1]|uniref:hypothetical protein n=1 Tax=Oribacterium sp. P6A1 TaxID=1410612 RepID=UPI00056B1B11|nr:hypothetical protein [Oribacterium sp. P6A1]